MFFLLSLGLFVTLRYLAWRTFYTIHFHDPASFTVALIIYVAELYGIVVYCLSIFVNLEPYHRPILPLPANEDSLPTIDVLIPTYNEPKELIETTLQAAMKIHYPRKKLRVFLLDDGGTEQKRNDPDQIKAFRALERHVTLQALCAELGTT